MIKDKILKYFILFQAILIQFTYSQQDGFDDLLHKLNASESENEKIDAYYNIIRFLFYSNSIEGYESYIDSLKNYSEKVNSKKAMATAYKCMSWTNLSGGEYFKGIIVLQEALELYNEINDREGITHVHINLGVLYYYLEEHDKALDNFFKSLKITENNNQYLHNAVKSNLGLVYRDMGEYELAIQYIKEALAFLETSEDYIFHYNYAKYSLASCYYELGDYDLAENYLSEVLKQKNITKIQIIQSRIYLAQIYLATNRKQEAIYLTKGIDVEAEAVNDTYVLKKVLTFLYTFNKEEKEFEKSLLYFEKLQELEKLAFDSENQIVLNLSSKLEEAENRLQSLTVEKEEELSNLSNIKLKLIAGISLLFILIMILMAIFLNYLRNKKNEANALLEQNQRVLEEKNKKLIEADNVTNQIFSLISNDVRIPVIGLSKYVELFKNELDGYSQADIEERSEYLTKQGLDIKRRLDKIINWAGYNSIDDNYNFEVINFNDTLFKVIDNQDLIKKITEKKLSIEINTDDECFIYFDDSVLKIIIVGILNDILSESEKGDKINIFNKQIPEGTSVIIQYSGNEFYTPMKNCQEIDQDFVFLDEEKMNKVDIILCKRLINDLDGDILVYKNEVNGETLFKIIFPNI